jgi:hypothetical protein
MKRSISIILSIFLLVTSFTVFSFGEDNTSDWNLQSSVIKDSNEADLIARTGDIDNFNFGWPENYSPFSGKSTPVHSYPWEIDSNDAKGTDRIMVVWT